MLLQIKKIGSKLFQCIVFLRNKAYDFHLLKTHKFPIPVISIGNIAVGGTGKTPLMRRLIEDLGEKSPIAILSRGYKGQLEQSRTGVQICSGHGPFYGPEMAGDEPFWLAEKLPYTHVFVGKNRTSSAEAATRQGAKLIILEDGMQHRTIARETEIVVLDAKDLFGKDAFLPLGKLRDSPQRLKEATLIVVNHCDTEAEYNSALNRIRAYSLAPIVGAKMRHIPSSQKKIGLFCGIGTPERFISALGAHEIVATLLLKDHEPIEEQKLKDFAEKCETCGAQALLCTEKDAVKLPKTLKLSLPIIPVEAHLEIAFNKDAWEQLIRRIRL